MLPAGKAMLHVGKGYKPRGGTSRPNGKDTFPLEEWEKSWKSASRKEKKGGENGRSGKKKIK